ncbi:MAG: hypothetical protein VYC38_15185 [Pseudomonadota bacterium]|nr:hypothetical protein [Pseudomonadota bacterium]
MDRKLVWDGQVATQQERKLLDIFQFFEDPCGELGQKYAFRFTDGHGGGCQVSGVLMGLKLKKTAEGVEANLEMSTDSDRDWRVW